MTNIGFDGALSPEEEKLLDVDFVEVDENDEQDPIAPRFQPHKQQQMGALQVEAMVPDISFLLVAELVTAVL